MTTHEKLTIIHNIIKDCASFSEEYGYGDCDSMQEAVTLIQEVKNEYEDMIINHLGND